MHTILRTALQLATLSVAALLCHSAQAQTTCRSECRIPITIPGGDDPGSAPTGFPDVFRIAGDTPIEFVVNGGSGSPGTVTLVFLEPVIARAQGGGPGDPWLYTLKLNPGNNAYRVRGYDAGLCHAPGCKFVVINSGQPNRRSVINSPTIIIDPR